MATRDLVLRVVGARVRREERRGIRGTRWPPGSSTRPCSRRGTSRRRRAWRPAGRGSAGRCRRALEVLARVEPLLASRARPCRVSNRNLSAFTDPGAGSFGPARRSRRAPSSSASAAQTGGRATKRRTDQSASIIPVICQRLADAMLRPASGIRPRGPASRVDAPGAKPRSVAGPGRVGERIAHVALLRGFAADRRAGGRSRGRSSSRTCVDRHAAAAADVIDGAGPSAVARRDGRRHGVGHEGEVARLLAVAVERDGLRRSAPRG